MFIKGEPHKKEKLNNGMLRIIAGMPLHKTAKNHAVFETFQAALANWENSPIMKGWSPVKPGHVRGLANRFKNRKPHSSDKPNWDFLAFKWVFEAFAEVVIELSECPEDMSQAEYDDWQHDVRSCVAEVSSKGRYRCSNGKIFASLWEGIVKSGWLLTFDFNSVAQLLVDVAVLVRMGICDDDILSYTIVVGGDDVIQSFCDGFDTDKYLSVAKEFGFPLSEFEVTDTFEGCEFFSTRFIKVHGIWAYKPERFTKHIENLRTVKIGDLAGALCSHMRNHVWDGPKFDFFHKMYLSFRKKYPNEFPLSRLEKRQAIQFQVAGYE